MSPGPAFGRITVKQSSHDPEKANQSGKEHLKAATEDLKAAAAGKIEDFCEKAGQKTEELRKAAEEKAKEASRAEHACSWCFFFVRLKIIHVNGSPSHA